MIETGLKGNLIIIPPEEFERLKEAYYETEEIRYDLASDYSWMRARGCKRLLILLGLTDLEQ